MPLCKAHSSSHLRFLNSSKQNSLSATFTQKGWGGGKGWINVIKCFNLPEISEDRTRKRVKRHDRNVKENHQRSKWPEQLIKTTTTTTIINKYSKIIINYIYIVEFLRALFYLIKHHFNVIPCWELRRRRLIFHEFWFVKFKVKKNKQNSTEQTEHADNHTEIETSSQRLVLKTNKKLIIHEQHFNLTSPIRGVKKEFKILATLIMLRLIDFTNTNMKNGYERQSV